MFQAAEINKVPRRGPKSAEAILMLLGEDARWRVWELVYAAVLVPDTACHPPEAPGAHSLAKVSICLMTRSTAARSASGG
jgi:hypothetical protein